MIGMAAKTVTGKPRKWIVPASAYCVSTPDSGPMSSLPSAPAPDPAAPGANGDGGHRRINQRQPPTSW